MASVILLLFIVWAYRCSCCEAFGTFGFDVHHRYSDRVKGILDVDGIGWPEKGTVDYYTAMAHRDHLQRGRHLAAATGSAPLTFSGGNETTQIPSFGYLYYANVTVGSPGLWFLVALDTGSPLFWLPCDCGSNCISGLKTASGQVIELNIYSPNTSSTSVAVSCNSTYCGQLAQCSSTRNTCAYQIEYVSNDTSSSGVLVEDILHLTSDDSQLKGVDAQIPLGCGIVETGSFLDGGAPNGLLGLGMSNISVPSVLASKGLTANSFSMCFGSDGIERIGRMSFGDTGSSEQGKTPFNVEKSTPIYNVTVTQVSVGDNVTDINFSAVFDSGTSFTTLAEPAYTLITASFNSQAQQPRHSSNSQIPFEYCYDLSANQSLETPSINLTMKGGDKFSLTDPIILVSLRNGGLMYCLALVKSEDISIIGQNFMTGYNIVFDLGNMVLGWEESNCYGIETGTFYPPESSAAPPGSLNPEATTEGSPNTSSSNDSTSLKSSLSILFVVIFAILIHCVIIGS